MRGSLGTIWPALAAATAIAVCPSIGRAQDAIRWIAPAECPQRAALQGEIESLLGRPWMANDGVRVDAEVSQDGAGGWVLRLTSEGAEERTLPGESCEALAQAAALLIAWMIDPAASGGPDVAPSSEPRAPREAPPPLMIAHPAHRLASPIVTSRAAASPLPAPARRAHARSSLALGAPVPSRHGTPYSIGLGAAFVLDLGTLPSVAPGFGLEAVVRIDRLDLRARGTWLSPQGASIINVAAAPSGAGVVVEYAGGALAGCVRPLDGDDQARPGFAICGGVQVGAMIAHGVGISSPDHEDAWTASLSAGAVMPWAPFEWLDLEIGLELVVPLATPTFEIAPFGPIYTQMPVAGRLSLGGHVDVR